MLSDRDMNLVGRLEDHNIAVVEAMEKYGGSFVKALARCFRCADARNFRKLQIAFPEYWAEYERMAKRI